MRGLFSKTLREVWLGTLLFGVGLLIVEVLLNFILPQITEEMSAVWMQLPFAKMLVGALLGVDIEQDLTAQVMQAIVWVHPVVLSLLWAHQIILCTRVPAGEIDRGTIDVLLGWPVSRRQLYLSETAVWTITGVFLMGMTLAGYLLGARAMPVDHRPELGRIVMVLINLYGLYIAVGGFACLTSSLCDRRGRAVSVIFTVVLASFLLNFIAQFWEPAQAFAFLGVLDYYKPAGIISTGTWPVRDLVVLMAVGGVTWTLGGVVLARRSICTV